MSEPKRNIDNDPAPQAPTQPGLDDCCRSGCVPCVFDLYEEAMERYRIELKAWEERQAKATARTARSSIRGKTHANKSA